MEGKMMKKLNKHPHYKDRTLEEKQTIARRCTEPDELKIMFSHLLEVGTNFAMNITSDDYFLSSAQAFDVQHQSVKQKMAQACSLPVKLSLQKIPEGRIPLIHSFTSRLKFEYGPLHASLTVGDVTLSWGRSSILQPKFDPRAEADFQAHVGDQGEWDIKKDSYMQQMSMADRHKSKEDKFEVIYDSMSEKSQMIDRLVDVIADYNRNKEYHMFKCNCQHFVQDAMAALSINKSLQFKGRLQQRFEQLTQGKQGKLQVPLELQSHESIDTYVQEHKDNLERQDMEYLQCLYFDFHLPAIEESDDPEWRCDKPECMSEELDRMIRENYVSLTQTKPFDTPAASRPTDSIGDEIPLQVVNGVFDSTQLRFVTAPEFSADEDDQETEQETPLTSAEEPEIVPLEDDVCSIQFLEMSLQKQTRLVNRCRGYRATVLTKYRLHPSYERGREDEMVEILTEKEQLYQNYFSSFTDRSKQYIWEITKDNEKLESGALTWKQLSANVRHRFDKLCNFPLRLVYRVDFRNVKTRKPVMQTPLSVFLQVDNVVLEWTKPGLVVPVKAEEPTGNVVRAEHIVLLEDLSKNSEWSKQVQSWRTMIESAIINKEQAVVVPIMYTVAEEQERLMDSLLQLVVKYNRYSRYHLKSCNNIHFIQEALKTLGVPKPPAMSTSLQEYMESLPTAAKYEEASVTEHTNLDSYVSKSLTGQLSIQEIEYFISKYFTFHIEDWKRLSKGKQDWTCSLTSCQLMHLLKLTTEQSAP